jgi:hypothetical protein
VYEETNSQNTTQGPVIYSPYITFKSQVQWGAVLRNSGVYGIQVLTSNITIDGFQIVNAYSSGISGYNSHWNYSSNLTVRNCWISYCGTNPASGKGPSGIANSPQDNTSISNNLIEHIGNSTEAIYDHGIYVAGTNLILANNVIRYCSGAGIQFNDHMTGGTGSTNVLIYNNLIYGNGHWGLYLESDNGNSVSVTMLNNTIVLCPFIICAATVSPARTYLYCTNNILIYSGGTVDAGTGNGYGQTLNDGLALSASSVINADYNIMSVVDNLPLGAHGIQTNNAWLVNTNIGLFWLTANSPARGAAYSGLYPTNDFFGNTQTSSVDIGAFQYNVLYSLDRRVLDPSPVYPDYWLDLTQLLPPSHLRIVPGSGQ